MLTIFRYRKTLYVPILQLFNFSIKIFLSSLLACHSTADIQRNGTDDVIHPCAEKLRSWMAPPGLYWLVLNILE